MLAIVLLTASGCGMMQSADGGESEGSASPSPAQTDDLRNDEHDESADDGSDDKEQAENENKGEDSEPEAPEKGVLGSWMPDGSGTNTASITYLQFEEDGEVGLLGDPTTDDPSANGMIQICKGPFDPQTEPPFDFTVTCADLTNPEAEGTTYSGSASLTAKDTLQVKWSTGKTSTLSYAGMVDPDDQ
ncbi:hypothetical protein CDO52_02455 [Nocardiopsis gilva YIM 90087]|uniref:Uncharacterized protein n=1 Tax=Nocardiopsis gilva YIM 90087 TaxID=1235441 RepID=A0A223S103_9ACTN|nr:hypothetical protein CDO52_02455 [Nocardiopsis gilva YIM 90087]